MSYTNSPRLVGEFDYDKLLRIAPWLKSVNPKGTCFAMSVQWLSRLMDFPWLQAEKLHEGLEQSLGALALIHAKFQKETGVQVVDQAQREAGYRTAFQKFGVRSPDLDAGGQTAGFKAVKDSTLDWMGCNDGDMWCAVFMWITTQVHHPYYAVLNHENGGHSLAVYVDAQLKIRVWDLNAGEFKIDGKQEWEAWTAELKAYYAATAPGVDEVTLISVTK